MINKIYTWRKNLLDWPPQFLQEINCCFQHITKKVSPSRIITSSLLNYFAMNAHILVSLHFITQLSHYSPLQNKVPGRFNPVFINQLRNTWHNTELLTRSLCLTDTEERAIHSCRTCFAEVACKSPLKPQWVHSNLFDVRKPRGSYASYAQEL